MPITIQKSTSGAYFTVQASSTSPILPYKVNDYDFIPNSDNTTFSLVKASHRVNKESIHDPSYDIITNQPYTNIINGDTGLAFADFTTLATYIETNFFRKAGGAASATWGAITGTLSAQTDLGTALNSKQDSLVSGTNIKTINSTSLLGSGNLSISAAPGGSDQQIQFNDGGAFDGNSNLQFNLSTSSTYIGNPLTTLGITAGNIVCVGDSLVSGTGASPSSMRFCTQLATLLGLTEVNSGVAGTSIGLNVVSNLSTYIPIKGVNDRYLVMCWGQNDINQNVSTYTSTNFQTDMTTVMNYVLTRGWLGSQVILTNISFNEGTPPSPLTQAQYITRQNQFSAVIDATAIAFGAIDVKINQLVQFAGGRALLYTDFQHPNNLGYTAFANLVYNTMFPKLLKSGTTLGIDGVTAINQLNGFKLSYLPDSGTTTFLGIDATGLVGKLVQLPSGTQTAGTFFINDTLYQPGWITPSGVTVTSRDICLNETARFLSFYTPNPGLNLCNYIQLMDASGHMNIATGPTPGNIQFKTGSGAGTTVASFNQNGSTTITGDMTMVISKKIYYDQGSYQGGYIPLNGSGQSVIYNSFITGYTSLLMSGGANGGSVEAMRVLPNTRMLLQNGGTYTDDSVNQLQVTGSIGISPTQTTVNGSTSGTAVFAQPFQGSKYKLVIIKMAALVGTASYTFPTAFATTPSVIATDDVASGIVTSKSTSAVTVTGSTTTGTITLIGY